MKITSHKNPLIKYLKQLQNKSKLRIKDRCFVVEGVREISMAYKYNYNFKKVLYVEKLYEENINFSSQTEVIQISHEVYKNIAYRSSTEGVIAVVDAPFHSLSQLKFKNPNPLILILESPEKPGNIGAILRTADAAQVDAVIIANPKTDLYNPNTIRASLGAIFSTPLAIGSSEEVYKYLVKNDFKLFAATLQNSNSYLAESYRDSSAFIMGSEAYGLTEFWRDKPNIKAVNIPMLGEIDSMNLSVSTAILTFEALRQRQK